MICYRCGAEVGSSATCAQCGTDLRVFQKASRVSNFYYNDGLKKAQVRNLSGAIVSLKTCLKLNKLHVDARNLLGMIYYEMGDVVDALSEWVISKSYQPIENRASFYLDSIQQNTGVLTSINQTIKKYNQVLLYCRQGSRDLAIIQLKKVLSMNPKLVKGHQLLALLYMQEGKLELAKKALRHAGRVDMNNTITLRYLKEVNTRLREQEPNNKPKNDDLISYQSGNETIIMPKRFKESSIGSTLLYIVLGLVVGAAVTGFLIVPNVRMQAQNEAQKQLLKLNDSITTYEQNIDSLNEQIEELHGQLTAADANSALVEQKIEAYEKLLNAYGFFAANDLNGAGQELEQLNVEQLSANAKSIYDSIYAAVNEQHLSQLYDSGYTKYSKGDYAGAIEDLKTVTDSDIDYHAGDAAYYLGQSYRRAGDPASAVPYYQHVLDHYPGTKRAQTAANYVNVP